MARAAPPAVVRLTRLRPPVPRLALNIDEAAASISLGVDVFRANVLPELRVVRNGRRVLVPVAELDRWLERNASKVY